jgi:glycosyltransferase involved in cell wall biosynthesis
MNKLISLCMIVKDEEAVLDRCLKSMHSWVDEIIIVDTGSTDKTISIAKKYTDKIYNFKWVNDFSAARNKSLKHATCSWILVLDADEYLSEKDAQTLRNTLLDVKPTEESIFSISIVSFIGKERDAVTTEAAVPRVFANHMGIYYSRAIHEQPTTAKGAFIPSTLLPVQAFHSGYIEETVATKRKHERNLAIFDRLRKETSFSAYDHLMLGNQYLMMADYDKALLHLQKSIQDKKKLGTIYKNALFSIMQVYFNTGRIIDAWNFTEEHLSPYFSYPDIIAWRGILLLRLGFLKQAKTLFHEAVTVAEERAATDLNICIISPDMGLSLPLKQLAELYEQEGDYNQAVHFLTKIMMTNPKDYKTLARLVFILSQQNEKSEVIISFLEKLLQSEQRLTIYSVLFTISIGLGLENLARTLMDKYPLNISLQLGDHLRYALLINNLAYFENHWRQASYDEKLDPRSLKMAVLATIAWDKDILLNEDINTDHEYYLYIQWAKSISSTTHFSEEINKYPRYSLELLSELYTIRQLETFDFLIDHVNSYELINGLANFFKERHQEELAFQYYSYLLDHDQLDIFSCTNLALYYFHRDSIDQAITFLEKAIEIKPNQKILYILLYNISKDSVQKTDVLNRLFEIDSTYRQLPLLK